MDRQEKEIFVANLKDVFNTSAVVVVAQNTGLTVAKMNELRSAMRDAGGQIKVIKNKLTKIALDGTPLSAIEEYLNGPSMLAYSDDPVAAPKIAIKFAKENKNFVVLGGSLPEKKIEFAIAICNIITMCTLQCAILLHYIRKAFATGECKD